MDGRRDPSRLVLLFASKAYPYPSDNSSKVSADPQRSRDYVDDDGNMEAEPKSLLADRRFGKGYPAENHIRNFLDCFKARRQPIAPAEGAHRANSTCQIANICLQLGRQLAWAPTREQFVDDPMADRKLARTMRAPWCF